MRVIDIYLRARIFADKFRPAPYGFQIFKRVCDFMYLYFFYRRHRSRGKSVIDVAFAYQRRSYVVYRVEKIDYITYPSVAFVYVYREYVGRVIYSVSQHLCI